MDYFNDSLIKFLHPFESFKILDPIASVWPESFSFCVPRKKESHTGSEQHEGE